MNYILVAYKDKYLGEYFLNARNDLNKYLKLKGKNILNDMNNNCDASTFTGNCITSTETEKNFVFYSHGDENSLSDSISNDFIHKEMNLSDYNIKIFYSVACETAKGNLKHEIIKNSNLFFGYNNLSYVAMGGDSEDIFIECDNYCIKKIISDELSNDELLESTEEFFRSKIKNLRDENYIVEAAFLMHNKEAIEIH